MPRVSVDLPERFAYTTEIPLYYHHINMGGHLDVGMALTLVTEARIRYLVALGHPELGDERLLAVTGDAAVQYISEAFYGEVMVVGLKASELNKYGFDLVFRVGDKTSGREVARGKLGIVFLDRHTRKIALLPDDLREKLTRNSQP